LELEPLFSDEVEPGISLDDYEANYVCNHTDVDGRYSFKNQPGIAHWNLGQLGKALSSIVNYESSTQALDECLESYDERLGEGLERLAKTAPLKAKNIKLSCSS
jgi:uncharacterized protein YdiU (UPF0061 family)